MKARNFNQFVIAIMILAGCNLSGTSTPPVQPVPPAQKINLVQNGDFANGTSGWVLWNDGSTQSTMGVVNGELKVDITNPGANKWNMGLSQRGLLLERGEIYCMKFQARADAPRTINFLVQLGKDPWTRYSSDVSVDLTATMAEYGQTFLMTNATDSDSDLELFLNALQTGTVYIDNIVIEKEGSGDEAEKSYPKVVSNADRSNLILYEISPGSYSRGRYDHGECLKDITAQLNRLRDMGINCIWINPILLGEGMGYWTYDYYRINPKLGTLNDMKELVYEAHKRDMLVIIDLVINHIWIEHPFFKDVVANGSGSAYADWFIWSGTPGSSDFDKPNNEQKLANINFNNSQAKEYMFTTAEYWLKKLDLDGYRVDVAMLLEDRHPGIGAELIDRLEAVKSNVFMLAEGYVNEARFFNNGYDSAYDWDYRGWDWSTTTENALNKVFLGTMSLQEMHDVLTRPIPGGGLPLRFAENHDMTRAASLWGIGGSKVAHTVAMTSRGYPMVYGGGEVGFAPDASRTWSQTEPIIWDYSCPLYAYFPKIVTIRKQYLRSDLLQYWIPNDNASIYSSLSVNGTNRLITVANFSAASATVNLTLTLPELGSIGGLKDLITGAGVSYAGGGSLVLTLGGYETAVLLVQ